MMMALRDLFKETTLALSERDKDEAYFEAEVLLAHALGLSRVQLYTQPEQLLTVGEVDLCRRWLGRLLKDEPLAYITGCREFYGLDFYVDRRTLVPRPETELITEVVLEFIGTTPFDEDAILIADIGTGSGCVGLSLALNLPQSKIYATDISGSALEVARINCERHNVGMQVVLLEGNLLEPLPQAVHLIVANLPYVAREEMTKLPPQIINYEPALALDGGKGGVQLIRCLIEQLPGKLKSGGALFLEIGAGQENDVVSLINRRFPQARTDVIPDLNHIDRVVSVYFSDCPASISPT